MGPIYWLLSPILYSSSNVVADTHTHTHAIDCHTSAHTFSLLPRPSWTSPTHTYAGSLDLQPGRCHKHTDKTISIISRVCQDVASQPCSHYHCFSIYSGSLNKRLGASWPRVITILTPTHRFTPFHIITYCTHSLTDDWCSVCVPELSVAALRWTGVISLLSDPRLAAVTPPDRKAGNITTSLDERDYCNSKTSIFIYNHDKKDKLLWEGKK